MTRKSSKTYTEFETVGCFKIGSQVYIGSSLDKIYTITSFYKSSSKPGHVIAGIKGRVCQDIANLSLAGPNGDGVGA